MKRFNGKDVTMMLIQDNVCDLSGTNTIVAGKIQLIQNKDTSQMYSCYNLTVIPKGLEVAIYAATYPAFPNCRFNGIPELMDECKLSKEEELSVHHIRFTMDNEFVFSGNEEKEIESVVEHRCQHVLSLVNSFRAKAEEERKEKLNEADKMVTVHISLPTYKVGKVIGRGGCNIREIKKVSNAKIEIGKESNKATLLGTKNCVDIATAMIRNYCSPDDIQIDEMM